MPIDSVGEDAEELCRLLQGHVRTLEQRELTQMRQGAILQRKLDSMEEDLRRVKQSSRHRFQDAERRREERLAERRSQDKRRGDEAAKALEGELHSRLDEARARRETLDRDLRTKHTMRTQVEKDFALWHGCARALRRDCSEKSKALGTAIQDVGPKCTKEVVAELQSNAEKLVAQMHVLEQNCAGLRTQLCEVEKLETTTRSHEVRLKEQNVSLEDDIRLIEASACQARDRATLAREYEIELRSEMEAFCARLEQEKQLVCQSAVRESDEELAWLRKRVGERSVMVERLREERARLTVATKRHYGSDCSRSDTLGLDSVPRQGEAYRGRIAAFDETVSWLVTLLFKSVLVRRFFCVHLAVLYSWLLFLLWWMSARAHRER